MDARFIGEGCDLYFGRGELSEETRAGLKAHLQTLEDSMRPAPAEAIIIALTRLASHFWNDRPANQWKIVFEDYAKDLGDIPADILGESLTLYRKRGKFWPKVSEILDIANPLLAKRLRLLARVRKLCGVKLESKTGIVPAFKRMPTEAA